MVGNIGINILIPLGLFTTLIVGAALMTNAVFGELAVRRSKK